MRLKITVAALLLCMATNLFSQTSGDHCVAFKANIDGSVGVVLTESQKSALTSKVDQILTRNNVATATKALYGGFVITPQIVIISEESLTMGVRPVITTLSEVTLLASNIIDGSNYGTLTMETKVTGGTQEESVTKIISSIRPTDPRITKFINSTVQRINDYYTMNMSTVLRKVETLLAGDKPEDAMALLESIPTCVPAYEQSSAAIQELYKLLSNRGVESTIEN